jgi:hypothetical protein
MGPETHVGNVCCYRIWTKSEICWQITVKLTNNKFHENPFRCSGVVTCGKMEGQTDMAKLMFIFVSFRWERAWLSPYLFIQWKTENYQTGTPDIVSHKTGFNPDSSSQVRKTCVQRNIKGTSIYWCFRWFSCNTKYCIFLRTGQYCTRTRTQIRVRTGPHTVIEKNTRAVYFLFHASFIHKFFLIFHW